MKKQLRSLSLLFAFFVLLVSIVSCADPSGAGLSGDDVTTDMPNSAMGEPLYETTSPKNPDTSIVEPEQAPVMAIEDGYTVVAEQNINLLVTENREKINHTARVAVLQSESGENALYLDVLTADNQIMASVIWKGYYQLFVNDEGILMLLRLWMSPITQRGTAVYQFFTVSDRKIANYDVVELETPEINPVPGEGMQINFAVGSPAQTARFELPFTDFMYRYRDALEVDEKDGEAIYFVADSYLHPDTPVLYPDADKVPFPDLRKKEIADKYTWEYASGLFGGI